MSLLSLDKREVKKTFLLSTSTRLENREKIMLEVQHYRVGGILKY